MPGNARETPGKHPGNTRETPGIKGAGLEKIHYLKFPICIGKYIVTLSLLLKSLLDNNDLYQDKVHSENNTKFVLCTVSEI